MDRLGLQKLNSGLSRVASVKSYPIVRKQFVMNRKGGRVFRLGVLHAKELSEQALANNRRGFINAQVNTVAHAPSLYHWLFHRCGIPFAEAQMHVRGGSLKVDDILVTKERDLECQLDWSTFQKLDVQVRSSLPSLQGTAMDVHGPAEGNGPSIQGAVEGPWVPALKRALHRSYYFLYIHPKISISSDEADPKSFVHRLTSVVGSSAALGLNVLRPMGFMNSMRGLGLATNDVSMVRYWNNDSLGNYGVYDIRFPRGISPEVVKCVYEDLVDVFSTRILPQLPEGIKIPISYSREPVPSAPGDTLNALYPTTSLHTERILACTPLMPYRMVRRIRRAGGLITLVRSGPFVLNPSIVQQGMRPLLPAELALLFTFERTLKTNRLILSLREFQTDTEASA